jgi:hypothetical protein
MARWVRSAVGSVVVGVAVVAMVPGAVAVAVAVAVATPIGFAPAVSSPTGGIVGPGPGAETTVVADLDGDGRLDVVVTDAATTTPRALLSTGGGHFAAARPLPATYGVLSIGTGDFNGDGWPDVVGRSPYAVVLWTGNGNGTFTHAQQVLTPSNAQPAIAVGDVDGDGRPDVLTTTITGFQVLRGTGTGLVAGPRTTAYGVLSDIAVGNLDGDGHPDVVLADATPLAQRARAFLGRGDGTFAPSGSAPTGFGPEAASLGDLNHDGFDDVVTSDSFSVISHPPRFSITVALSDGHGGFVSRATYPTANGPVSGAIGDLDQDGDLDVVVSGVIGASLAAYSNDGSGVLTPFAVPAVAIAPQTPAIADFDGDGHPDIAVPGVGQLSVLLNGA